jgi:uncharacterized membrane protein YebE (DUF533 family)
VQAQLFHRRKGNALMVDVNKILNGISASGIASGFAGGLAGGVLTNALTGKKGKKIAKSALTYGGIAALGGLAYKAYSSYRQSQAATQSDTMEMREERFVDALNPTNPTNNRWLMIQAMVSAAMADGHIDSAEQTKVFAEVDRLGLTPGEKALLLDEMRSPKSVAELTAAVPNPETALEVYAAALLAVDETQPQATAYLKQLATALQLPTSLTSTMQATVVGQLQSAA